MMQAISSVPQHHTHTHPISFTTHTPSPSPHTHTHTHPNPPPRSLQCRDIAPAMASAISAPASSKPKLRPSPPRPSLRRSEAANSPAGRPRRSGSGRSRRTCGAKEMTCTRPSMVGHDQPQPVVADSLDNVSVLQAVHLSPTCGAKEMTCRWSKQCCIISLVAPGGAVTRTQHTPAGPNR